MNEEARVKIVKARIALISEQPFFGALALRLLMVENPSIPTLAVNGKSIFYNPQFINSLSHSLIKSAVAHEVGHCVFEHIARRGDRNPMKWNFAGDYVINAMLKDAGFELGEGWLHNSAYANMSSDHVYSLLPDPPAGGGNGPGVGDPGGPLCEIQDADTKDDASSVDEWKIAAVQAATAARQAGKLPATLERFIGELINPKADWRSLLRRFVTEINKADYSWARPNKRFIHAGFYLPTLFSEGMGEIDIAVDTSGSITQPMLDTFQAEIQAIRDVVRPRLTRIIYCDAAVNHVDEFAAEDLLEMKMHGGGGTDFNPPFDLIAEQGWRPSCFLYLTDLYGPAPATPPDYPCMWVCTTNQAEPWGERVEIEV